jgi:hypothetical protein
VFRNEIAIEYQGAAVDAVLRGPKGIGVLQAEAKAEALQRRLAAERAVDSVLADSFPASDPPSWTLGITHPQPERETTNGETVSADQGPVVPAAGVIDVSGPPTDKRTFLTGLRSLITAAAFALLVPFVILLIGAPVALAVRGIAEAASWLLAIFG